MLTILLYTSSRSQPELRHFPLTGQSSGLVPTKGAVGHIERTLPVLSYYRYWYVTTSSSYGSLSSAEFLPQEGSSQTPSSVAVSPMET